MSNANLKDFPLNSALFGLAGHLEDMIASKIAIAGA